MEPPPPPFLQFFTEMRGWFDEIGHFSSVRRTCQQPQATPMLVTRQFESRAFFGTRPDKSRLAFQPEFAEWRVASTPNQHCRRGDAEMASGTQKSRTSQHEQRPPPQRRRAGVLRRSKGRYCPERGSMRSPNPRRIPSNAGKTGSPCASAIAELGGTIASMKLSGIQKLTLLDFPGRTAATVFTPGCNFRCPFCHNADLVLGERSVTTCAPGSGNGGVTEPTSGAASEKDEKPPMPASEKAEVPLAGAGLNAAGLFPAYELRRLLLLPGQAEGASGRRMRHRRGAAAPAGPGRFLRSRARTRIRRQAGHERQLPRPAAGAREPRAGGLCGHGREERA